MDYKLTVFVLKFTFINVYIFEKKQLYYFLIFIFYFCFL